MKWKKVERVEGEKVVTWYVFDVAEYLVAVQSDGFSEIWHGGYGISRQCRNVEKGKVWVETKLRKLIQKQNEQYRKAGLL